ncbi:hypothetical protein WA026_010937, partial [Henosepilachna vigintioctopunctata]
SKDSKQRETISTENLSCKELNTNYQRSNTHADTKDRYVIIHLDIAGMERTEKRDPQRPLGPRVTPLFHEKKEPIRREKEAKSVDQIN